MLKDKEVEESTKKLNAAGTRLWLIRAKKMSDCRVVVEDIGPGIRSARVVHEDLPK